MPVKKRERWKMSVRKRALLLTIIALITVSVVMLLVPALRQSFIYAWLPFAAVVVSLLFERKPARFLALVVTLVAYYGAVLEFLAQGLIYS